MKGLYLLALLPNETIAEEVMQWKQLFATNYNARYGLKVLPHITLLPPMPLSENLAETLADEIAQLVLLHSPFSIELNGFGYFLGRRSDVIYVKPMPNIHINQLYQDLLGIVNTLNILGGQLSPSNNYKPHLTIAYRDLKRAEWKKAWPEFEHKDYERIMIVNEVHLLKHDGKQWQRFKAFRFENNSAISNL